MSRLTTVGDRIKLKQDGKELAGLVKFIGEIQGKIGIFYGVELDEKYDGDNDGSIENIYYFQTTQNKGVFIKKSLITKTNSNNNNAPRVTVGDKVMVSKYNCLGIIRFIGETDFKEGIWYGIQLEIQNGKNNGTVKGKVYFKCDDKYGVFVRDNGFEIIVNNNKLNKNNLIDSSTLNIDSKENEANEIDKKITEQDQFNKKIKEVCTQNINDTFLICCNINDVNDSKSIDDKLSNLVRNQLINNISCSIEILLKQYCKYNLLIFKLCDNKFSIIIIMDEKNKNENKKMIEEISSSLKLIIMEGCSIKSVSMAVTVKKRNENENLWLQRTENAINKTKENIIYYDSKYFQINQDEEITALNVFGNEIITICIGQCGTSMGTQFFSTIMNEHKIDKQGILNCNNNDKINTYFEYKKNYYHPRTIFIDLDKQNIDNIQSSNLGSLIDKNNFIGTSLIKTNSCWAQGRYNDGTKIIDKAVNCIRSHLERCDTPQGFNFMNSINSGTGGGFGSFLMTKLKDEFGQLISAAFCMYPSKNPSSSKNSDSHILENYNSILSLNSMNKIIDIIFVFDNDSLDRICHKRLKLLNPTFNDYNWLISMVLSGITSSFRFYNEVHLNSSLQLLYETNAIFPGNVHLSASHSPYLVRNTLNNNNIITTSSIYSQLFSSINNVSNIEITKGKILNYSCIYKCNKENIMQKTDEYLHKQFVVGSLWNNKTEFNPFPFQSSCIYNQCSYYNEYTPLITTSIIHSTAITSVYKHIQQNFEKHFKEKRMISSYYDQGMESQQFIEAQQSINNLIQKYDGIEKGDMMHEVKDNDEDIDNDEQN